MTDAYAVTMKNLGALLLIGLVVYSVVDVLSSDEHERIGLPRWAWVVLLLLVPLAGSIVWIVVSRTQRARHQTDGQGGQGGRVLPSAPVAPDDDPEFLWRLEQQRREAERTQHRDPLDQEGGDRGTGETGNRETGPDAGGRPRS